MYYILLTLLLALGVVPTSARETYNLNSGWQFFGATEQSADNAKYINLPHSFSPEELTQANYFKRIYAPKEWRARRVFIKFEGVQRVANLFVNGRHAGEHRGGATAFTFEITSLLKIQDNNTLYVVVDNSSQSDVLPTSVEHTIHGGIYRDVEIITTSTSAISPTFYSSDGVFVTTSEATAQHARGEVSVHLLRDKEEEECSVDISITDNSGAEVFSTTESDIPYGVESINIPFEVKRPKLWSPSSPELYNITATLRSPTSEDAVTIKSGFRTIEIDDKHAIKINSQKVNIRGVALYHDYPTVGGALTPKLLKRDMTLVKEMGATAIRSALYPHDGYLYDMCDEQGVMAWVDTPFHSTQFLSDVSFYPTPRFRENAHQQMREIIAQNYNHPSIIMWGLFSTLASRGDDFLPLLEELKSISHEMDSTRPSVALSNQNGKHNNIPELIVWRQNIGWDRGSLSDIEAWSRMLHSSWGYMSSAVSYGEAGDVENQSHYTQSARRRNDNGEWFPEGRQRQFHEEYARALNNDKLFWGVWLNAMFDFRSQRYDTGMNFSGLVSFNREERKDIFYLYKAMWNDSEKTLYIANRRNTAVSTPTITIHIYTSDDSTAPTLHVGDKSYATRKIAPSHFIAEDVAIDSVQEVVVKQGKLLDKVTFRYNSPLEPKES